MSEARKQDEIFKILVYTAKQKCQRLRRELRQAKQEIAKLKEVWSERGAN